MKKQIFQSISYWAFVPMIISGIFLAALICVEYNTFKDDGLFLDDSFRCTQQQHQKISRSLRSLELAEHRFLAFGDKSELTACQENLKGFSEVLGASTCFVSSNNVDSSIIKLLCHSIGNKLVLSKTASEKKTAPDQLTLMWEATQLTDSLRNIIIQFENDGIASIQNTYQKKSLHLIWWRNLLLSVTILFFFFPGFLYVYDLRKHVSKRRLGNEPFGKDALNISEDENGILFSDNPIPMWVISIPEKRFLEVNDAAMTHYGYSREEFLRMSIYDIRPYSEAKKLKSNEFNAQNSLYYTAGVWMHQKKDGTLIKVNITVHNLSFRGREAKLILANDVSHKMIVEESLNNSLDELSDLAMHLEKVRESERTHIAREIHDELGQQLTVLKMNISWLQKGAGKDNESTQEKLGETLQLIDSTMETVRRIATDLRPSILDDLGLVATLEWQTQNFERNANITCKFSSSEAEMQVSPDIATGIFRVYQECLTNVLRHSGASSVMCDLQIDQDVMMFHVADNGNGFSSAGLVPKKTLGLRGMRERIKLLGGSFDITSEQGMGTSILITVPLNDKKMKNKQKSDA
jgi:PAS domain S-box-containing protein